MPWRVCFMERCINLNEHILWESFIICVLNLVSGDLAGNHAGVLRGCFQLFVYCIKPNPLFYLALSLSHWISMA